MKKVVDDDTTYLFKRDKYNVPLITAPVKIDVSTKNISSDVTVGKWDPAARFEQSPNYVPGKIRRFFRVGESSF